MEVIIFVSKKVGKILQIYLNFISKYNIIFITDNRSRLILKISDLPVYSKFFLFSDDDM